MCRYTYICMRERQHIQKHTDIQTLTNLGTYTHKQNPYFKTNTTKKLTILTSFFLNFVFYLSFMQTFHSG